MNGRGDVPAVSGVTGVDAEGRADVGGPVTRPGRVGPLERVGLLVVAAVAAVQVALGTVWWVANIAAVPEYGDTPEYLALSDLLQVDSFRTLFYPLVVRGAREAGELLHVPWVALLYTVQLVVAVAATLFLVRALAPTLPRVASAAVTAVLVTLPLPLHYTATVLTDSLATSFLLLVVAGLVRWAAHDDLGRGTLAALAGGTLLSVLMRPERLYIVTAAAGLTAVLVAVRTARRGPRAPVRAVVSVGLVLVLAVVLPAVGASVANRATQTAEFRRPPVTLVGTLYDRIAYPHLDDVRGSLPPELADAVPPAPPEVTAPTAWRVETLGRLRAVGGDDAVMTVVRHVLDCCAAQVVLDVARDVSYATLGPYAVARDVVTESSMTGWNTSRMSAHRPDLSRAVLAWSLLATAVLGVLTAVLLVGAARRRTAPPPGLGTAALVLAGVVLSVSGAFGVVSSIPVNTRYTLVTQIAAWALPLTWLAWSRMRRSVAPATVRSPRPVVPTREVAP